MLDLRLPSGMFFGLMGIILVVYSFAAPDNRAPLTDVNVNLYCGIFMLVFGGFLLALAKRAASHPDHD
jgi:hypothetical protein